MHRIAILIMEVLGVMSFVVIVILLLAVMVGLMPEVIAMYKLG